MFRPSYKMAFALFVASVLAAQQAFACSSCGCSLSTDWQSQGISTEPGYRLDIRVDDINQDRLFHGAHLAGVNDYRPDTEIERYTHNLYTTLGFDYTADQNWGVNVQAPLLKRWHGTIPPGETATLTSSYHELSDVRVVGRYQGLTQDHNVGLLFGVKLPTGSYNQTFGDGSALDRSLQPGTGTTDAILGVYSFDNFLESWAWFAQMQIQEPLAQRDGYRPGETITANLGVRYAATEWAIPQFQLIGVRRGRDRGVEADSVNNGGELIYLSPGMTVVPAENWSVTGFVQVPVFKMVNGLQLTPQYLLTGSVSYHF
jgi:hypothetical protein